MRPRRSHPGPPPPPTRAPSPPGRPTEGPHRLVLKHAAAEQARRGHPWIWDTAILGGTPRLAAGDEVTLIDERAAAGEIVGRGIADPGSPIRVRMWTTGEAIRDALITERIASALDLRARLFASSEGTASATTAYRLLHGEGDRVPGFVVDRYGAIAVLRTDGEAALALRDRFAALLQPLLEAAGITTLVHRATSRKGPVTSTVLFGPPPPATVDVTEHGVPFRVDLAQGQKTGAFLDQRENRRRVGTFARGRRALNLFSYAGGFSLHAALGGATHVTSVDIAAGAHATAQASFRLAGIDPRAHAFVAADAFAFLEGAKQRGERWDLIVSDPPSFAPSEKAKPRALAAYRALHRACVEVLAPGGVFCAASCSSHIDGETFVATLDDATLGGRPLRLLEVFGPPPDHPTLPAWPEGRYLKFAVIA